MFSVCQGDAAVWLKSAGDQTFDVTICDPPYTARVHRNLMRVDKGKPSRVASEFPPLEDLDFVSELVRVTRRWVLIFCALEQFGDYQRAAPGVWIRSGIYHKQRACPQLSGDRPGNSCEGVAIFHRSGKKRWNGGGHHAFWSAMPEARTVNEAAKPLALMIELVRLFSEPDERILDPFMGSGTTGVAALRLGRRFVGLDIREEQFRHSAARLRGETDGRTSKDGRQLHLFEAVC